MNNNSKEVQQKRSGLFSSTKTTNTSTTNSMNSIFCHSYDLHGYLNDQISNISEKYSICNILQSLESMNNKNHDNDQHQNGFQYFISLVKKINDIILRKPRTVIRILFYRPHQIGILSIAIQLLVAHVRMHKLPVVMMVSVQPWTISNIDIILLRRCCSDIVIQCESFISRREYPPPPEFQMIHGLLYIHKVSTSTASLGHYADYTITKRPPSNLYGLKRDRRKLHIQLLHIPPEDYGMGGTTTTTTNTTTTANTSTNQTKKEEKIDTERKGTSTNTVSGSASRTMNSSNKHSGSGCSTHAW